MRQTQRNVYNTVLINIHHSTQDKHQFHQQQLDQEDRFKTQ